MKIAKKFQILCNLNLNRTFYYFVIQNYIDTELLKVLFRNIPTFS